MSNRLINSVLLASACFIAHSANAAVNYGVYGDASSQARSTAQSGGHTATILSDLSAASLGGINVLWVLNGNNGAPTAELGLNAASVASFVQGGGVLIYSDRNVSGAAGVLPGAAGITFVRDLGSDIDVQNVVNPLVNGPGGTVTSSNLDGGNFSDHGYILGATLPTGGVGILNNGTIGDFVDSYYGYGSGFVYYSTIPIDFYFGGASSTFTSLYAPNLVAEGASLFDGETPAVPEPATWAMMIGGFGMVGAGLRRRARVKVAFG